MDHSPPKDTPVLPVIPLCPRPLKTQPDVTQALAACVDLAPHLRPCFGLPKTLLFRPVSCTDTAPVLPPLSPGNPQALVVASAAAEQAAVHGDGAGLLLLLTASLLTQARDLLALGVEGAEIRAGYRLGCGRALALLEQQGVCGRLGEPRDELQVGATLGPFLSAWQPGFDVALGVAAARCCVYGWTPVTSGECGEVWEGVTFDPSTLRVCTVLDDSRDEAVGKEEEEEEEDRAGRDDYTEFGGEEHPDVEDEIDKMGEEVSQETQTAETDREPTTEPRGEEEKPATDRATHSNKKNKYDKDSTGQGEEDTPSQLEKKKTTLVKGREGEEEDDEDVETEVFDDWVDLGVEIWEAVCDSARDNGVVWSEYTTQQERLGDATRLEAARRNPLSINMHAGTETEQTIHGFSNEPTMHKHITSAHSAHFKEQINRPRGNPSQAARQKPSSTSLDAPSPGKAIPTLRHSHASSALPGLRLPLQASAVVEEPKDGSARPGVRLTLRSPDASLLVSAQGAVQACLRVYRSLLAEPRLVAGAGVAELALAVGLTQQGLGLVGMEQLVVHAFAQALLQPARVLGENSGDPGDLAVLRLYRSHREKEKEGVWSRETQRYSGTDCLPSRTHSSTVALTTPGCHSNSVGVADLHHLPVHPIITGAGKPDGVARLTSDTPCSVIVCVTCPRSRHLRFVATPALKSCGGGRYRGVLRTKKSSRVTG
ncbi:uncharacterized protein LOC115529937 [Gadus morhua]|uniref:uncharacterized protein LOC115529937 n=1 Tax=Gadus morhua TaxID=8049 RepID=UPI0011B4EAAF|nr:uncharacterized protein LOC115529937 [Gadus morhua]